jgi:septum site-determining protein MinD
MLAIAGGKGGCGKTTTALGLARGLSEIGHRPLVVDADLDMPDLHQRGGVDPMPGIPTVAEGAQPVAVAQPATEVHGVDILPCGGADTATAGSVLARLEQSRRPVLLDCPAGAGPDAAVPLRAADYAVIVSTPNDRSLRDAAKTASMARQLDVDVAAVVLVRSDGLTDPGTLFACDRIVHVPDVSGTPLHTQTVVDRYRDCAKRVVDRTSVPQTTVTDIG